MKYILIHWLPECSGGLCDRILGMTGNLCISRQLNMKMYIKWDIVNLGENLKINDKYNYYRIINYSNIEYKSITLNNFELMDYIQYTNIINEWKNKNILIWSNINLYNYFIKNKLITLPIHNHIKNFSICLKIILHKYLSINPYILLNIPTYDIGIHIRTGDKHFYDKNRESENIEYIKNIFNKIVNFNSDFFLKKTIFISSDCNIAYDIAKDYFKNIYYNNGDIIHTAISNNNNGIYKVLKDLFTLCNCKTLYIGWNSNFSRLASLYDINRDIICYEYENTNIIKYISFEKLFEYHSYGKYN
jgi:hypothetical protein